MRYGLPVIIVAAGIFAVSQLSAATISDSSASDSALAIFGEFTDEVAHFVEYFALSALILRWILATRAPARAERLVVMVLQPTAWIAITLAILYGISDEAHQWFIDGRSVELKDLVIDGAGAVTGAVVYLTVYAMYRTWQLRSSRKFVLSTGAPTEARVIPAGEHVSD